MATSPEEGLEKSATLLIALGEDHAAEVLKHLAARGAKIGHAMAALKSVPRAKVEGIDDPSGDEMAATMFLDRSTTRNADVNRRAGRQGLQIDFCILQWKS